MRFGTRRGRRFRGAGRFEIEHDPANGDLYLRPLDRAGNGADRNAVPEAAPAVLFVGTEKGFTYRLTLVPVAGGPAQVLIRNPAVAKPPRRRTSRLPAMTGRERRSRRLPARERPGTGSGPGRDGDRLRQF